MSSAPGGSPVWLVRDLGPARKRLSGASSRATCAVQRREPGHCEAGKDRSAALGLGVAPGPLPGRRPDASCGATLPEQGARPKIGRPGAVTPATVRPACVIIGSHRAGRTTAVLLHPCEAHLRSPDRSGTKPPRNEQSPDAMVAVQGGGCPLHHSQPSQVPESYPNILPIDRRASPCRCGSPGGLWERSLATDHEHLDGHGNMAA